MSLPCFTKDWTEGDLKGLPSLCQSSMKEVCLSCWPLTFWSHTWGTPFQQTLSRKTEFREHPFKKGFTDFHKHLGFQESPESSILRACVFCLPTPMLLTGLTCLRAQRRVYRCALRRQALPEGLGGCRTPRPGEQLRGSAALCWKMRTDPELQEVLGEKLHLPAHKHSEPPVQAQTRGYSLLFVIAARSTPISTFASTGAVWM